MDQDTKFIADGGVTTPSGFLAGGVWAGIRADSRKLDLGLLYSEKPCTVAGVYTNNRVKAAPLLVTQKHLSGGGARAVIANSGCANAATGQQGIEDAVEMAGLASGKLKVDPYEVVVASTGVIGTLLPMDRIRSGVEQVVLSTESGLDFARAIMTTDTRPKQVAVKFGAYTLGGVSKGSGMIHPNMATMLSFITTDAPVATGFLSSALKEAVDSSFNMIDVDRDTSTNDMAVVLANGAGGGQVIEQGQPGADAFAAALTRVCIHLAREIVADAEGATKVIVTKVGGARTLEDARKAAREVVSSLALKTAVYGEDPNWGRILAAVGNSGAEMREESTALYLGNPDGGELCMFRNGSPQPYDRVLAERCLAPREVSLRVDLGMGEAEATAWGSDLTEEYVRLNSQYTT